MPPPFAPSEPDPDLLSTPADRLDDAALLAAVHEDGASQRFVLLRRFSDWFLAERLRRASLDTRRRARFVVVLAFVMVPFYGVLTVQLWSSGPQVQGLVAALFGLAVLGSAVLLRLTRSHVIPEIGRAHV